MLETLSATKLAELKKKYPTALNPVFDRATEILPYLRPDLTVKINKADCMKVNFTMKYIPLLADVIHPPAAPFDKRTIHVLFLDDHGVHTNRTYMVARTGDEITDTVELPLPKDVAPTAGWSRNIYVLTDPLNEVIERNEGNNFAKIKGVC